MGRSLVLAFGTGYSGEGATYAELTVFDRPATDGSPVSPDGRSLYAATGAISVLAVRP